MLGGPRSFSCSHWLKLDLYQFQVWSSIKISIFCNQNTHKKRRKQFDWQIRGEYIWGLRVLQMNSYNHENDCNIRDALSRQKHFIGVLAYKLISKWTLIALSQAQNYVLQNGFLSFSNEPHQTKHELHSNNVSSFTVLRSTTLPSPIRKHNIIPFCVT